MRYTPDAEAAILHMAEAGRIFSEATLAKVRAAYDQPNRHYHVWDHVLDCLRTAERGGLTWNHEFNQATRDAIVAAAIYHDIVYEVPAQPGENEARSGAELVLETAKYPLAIEMIRASGQHGKLNIGDVSLPVAYFLDMDLSSLAAPYPDFLRNNADITNEYLVAYKPTAVREGRIAFLNAMLAKPTIFLTDALGSQFEWKARANIVRWLKENA